MSRHYTTARVNAAQILAVGVGVMLPLYCCWCAFYTTARVNAACFFGHWCRRYVAHFSAVGAAFDTTARVNAACFFGHWCRRYAAHFSAVGAAFYTTARVNAACFSAVGVGVTLPNFSAGIWRRRGRLRS